MEFSKGNINVNFIPEGCWIDLAGLIHDHDGTTLEICEKCGEYCLPEIVINLECICDYCQNRY